MLKRVKAAYKSYTSELKLQRDIVRKEKTALELAKVIFPDLAKTQKQLYKHSGSSDQETQSRRVIDEGGQSQKGTATFKFLNSRGLLFKGVVSYDENSGQPAFGDHRPFALISDHGYAGHNVTATDERGVPMDAIGRAPEYTSEFLDEVVTTLSQIAAEKES